MGSGIQFPCSHGRLSLIHIWQKSGSVSEKLEENGNEDLAESSESKNGQPDGKQDQENGAGAEKNENGGNRCV